MQIPQAQGAPPGIKIESAWLSDIGRVRKSNQDSVGTFPGFELFVVADGMGGLASGEVASRSAVAAVHAYFARQQSSLPHDESQNSADPLALRGQLVDAIVDANRQVVSATGQAVAPSGRQGGGSTVVVLRLDTSARQAAWAHVGDSRLYRLRRGELELLTADHTVHGARFTTGQPVPLDLPHSNMLTQALGIADTVEVSVGSDPAEVGDVYLLCTDGLSEPLEPALVQAELSSSDALETIGNRLLQSALERSGRDNTSLVLVRLKAA
jgi:PPM family protein phosphatase